jgi:murein DD-endopeptidase MepM/ murein hydrolase activator NlpD
MAWPLAKATSFRYRNNYRDGRFGEPEPYNHWHSRRNGVLRRAHDGVDIYARRGARVLAPFAGTVIDPAKRWKPWRADRYGRVVVIVSDEPTSTGYAVILSHLDRTVVKVGDHVRRGQHVGNNGTTGNARGGPPHIHLELRAPFMLRWKELGRRRLVDAFDPFPSLRRADPRRD